MVYDRLSYTSILQDKNVYELVRRKSNDCEWSCLVTICTVYHIGETSVHWRATLSENSFLFQYCAVPQWLLMYTVIIAIFIPVAITLFINVRLFKYVHSSFRRVRPQVTVTATGVSNQRQSIISRRDLSLLKHIVFMFSMFAIGWTPIFSLVAIDYSYSVSPMVYTLLQVLAVVCLFVCVCDLFLCDQDLKRYIKEHVWRCC